VIKQQGDYYLGQTASYRDTIDDCESQLVLRVAFGNHLNPSSQGPICTLIVSQVLEHVNVNIAHLLP